MDAGRYLFVVGVPPGFEADLRRGRGRRCIIIAVAGAIRLIASLALFRRSVSAGR